LLAREALHITTPEDAESRLDTRFYPSGDFIRGLGHKASQRKLENLLALITSHIAPQTWEDVGGPGAASVVRGHTVVISQVVPVHREIAGVLSVLRKARRDRSTRPQEIATLVYDFDARDRLTPLLQKLDGRTFECKLGEFAKQLTQDTGIYFHIDRKRLDEVGCSPESMVRGDYRNLPLMEVVRQTLKPQELSIRILEDAVVITTPESAESRLETRLHPIYDLIPHAGKAPLQELASLISTVVGAAKLGRCRRTRRDHAVGRPTGADRRSDARRAGGRTPFSRPGPHR